MKRAAHSISKRPRPDAAFRNRSGRSPAPAIARPAVSRLFGSQIREVANAGLGDPDLLAFWFGEPDQVTPAFIREAAVRSLAHGETFYTHNFGIPELRDAIAGYVSRLHATINSDRVAVTASGMSALMLAHTSMNLSSFRVLTDSGVKAYFAR